MANMFYAVFGVCRRLGGTKKKCYTKAIDIVTKKNKRKNKKKRKTSKRGR